MPDQEGVTVHRGYCKSVLMRYITPLIFKTWATAKCRLQSIGKRPPSGPAPKMISSLSFNLNHVMRRSLFFSNKRGRSILSSRCYFNSMFTRSESAAVPQAGRISS